VSNEYEDLFSKYGQDFASVRNQVIKLYKDLFFFFFKRWSRNEVPKQYEDLFSKDGKDFAFARNQVLKLYEDLFFF